MKCTITESGMVFGPMEESKLYHIEQSDEYKAIQNETKIAEFIYWRESENRLIVLEAKSTFAKSEKERSAEVAIICEKFLNSLDIYLASLIKKNLKPIFSQIDYNRLSLRFTLVIKDYTKDGTNQLTDKIRQELNKVIRAKKIWKPICYVLNLEEAKKRGLIGGNSDFWE